MVYFIRKKINLYKIITTLIRNRIVITLEYKGEIDKAQHGFRKNLSTSHAIITLKTIIQVAKQENRNIHITLVYLKAAYDSVVHNKLWKKLKKKSISQSYSDLIQNFYEDALTQVITMHGLTDPYEVKRGLRQGDPLNIII